MSEDDPWKGWYQDQKPPAAVGEPAHGTAGPAGANGAAGKAAGKTVPVPAPGATFTPQASAPAGGAQQPTAAMWPAQPPTTSAPGGGFSPAGTPGVPGTPGTPVRRGRRWRFWGQPGRRRRRIALVIGVAVVVIIAALGGTYLWIDGKLNRSVTLPAFTGTSAGDNWLITGADSRRGLSRAEIDKLHVGFNFGTLNSDSIMLLHMGGGRPVLISIPRDSYVPIPGHGDNKINAALGFGGPALLIKTVEEVTGLRIDHYMGIGFGGLVSVVDNVGGVRICLPTALHDSYSGLNLSKGCHNLDGAQALSFVRDRHSFATSDLQRIQDQRAFLKALLAKATSPGVYLNPFTAFPFASAAAGSISVDKGTNLYDLLQVAFALRNPETGTVPISNPSYFTNAGDSVLWNRTQALALFNALKQDKPVPKGLLTGTKIG